MRSFWLALVLAACLALAMPFVAGAVSLDIEAKGAGGLALGSTSNPNETGSPRAAFAGGIGVDVFLVTVGPVDLGVSVGAEYDSLNNHGVLNNFESAMVGPGITQTTDNTYNYLQFPISVVGRIPLCAVPCPDLARGSFHRAFRGRLIVCQLQFEPLRIPNFHNAGFKQYYRRGVWPSLHRRRGYRVGRQFLAFPGGRVRHGIDEYTGYRSDRRSWRLPLLGHVLVRHGNDRHQVQRFLELREAPADPSGLSSHACTFSSSTAFAFSETCSAFLQPGMTAVTIGFLRHHDKAQAAMGTPAGTSSALTFIASAAMASSS